MNQEHKMNQAINGGCRLGIGRSIINKNILLPILPIVAHLPPSERQYNQFFGSLVMDNLVRPKIFCNATSVASNRDLMLLVHFIN
jgi:hypothetical protein